MAEDIRCILPQEHSPLIEALHRRGAGVGTSAVAKVRGLMNNPELLPPLDEEMRLLTISMRSVPLMNRLLVAIGEDLAGTDYARDMRMGRIVLLATPAGTAIAVFIDVLVVPESELY
jgi:hypothetical protein